ncbi:class I SAM-dependent methyltransferase [Devosia sp. SL43]|uniref:class I SAM-dependent methyltransferase n=1 Tax=Devosia sp. SL43 TaxID=2806348 RepID=UPI001F3DEFF2|nr:class I SAM-dependent methyltransferase [Devosia sp. SL43]UJW85095.1 class I SAM-dependent methyltransferase [Devosia sp. SL43]
MSDVQRVAGSFRDPAGYVFTHGDAVFRAAAPSAAPGFRQFLDSPLFGKLIAAQRLVGTEIVAESDWPIAHESGGLIVRHETIPFISYPYEWPFALLKAAALLHLSVQIESLEHGFVLSDASAYNVQFIGPRPVFIDALSFRPYRDGEVWAGHRQFCQQFLNPLLLQALNGVAYQNWFRGSLEGIESRDLAAMLPWSSRFSPSVLAHVLAPAYSAGRAAKQGSVALSQARDVTLPKARYLGLLQQLRQWIETLQPKGVDSTTWQQYDVNNSYSDAEHEAKRRVVAAFCKRVKPARIVDIGCNTGEYAQLALGSGAAMAVGLDFDQGALDKAHQRARDKTLNLLPLWQDAANPSPGIGWRNKERAPMAERTRFDAVLALAVEHHLAIGRNVPLDEVVDYLTGFAPQGIVEFVPKSDPMIQTMLALRGDIFPDYGQEQFETALRKRARIVSSEAISSDGRMLYGFDRS